MVSKIRNGGKKHEKYSVRSKSPKKIIFISEAHEKFYYEKFYYEKLKEVILSINLQINRKKYRSIKQEK